MNEFVRKNIFLVWDGHYIHSALHRFYSTTHHFWALNISNDCLLRLPPPNIQMFLHWFVSVVVLLRLSVLLHYFSRFLYFSMYPDEASSLRLVWDCPRTPYKEYRLTPPKDSIIVRYSEFDFLLFSGLPLNLTTVIVCRIVLFLILIVLSRPWIDFLLFWSVCLFLAFSLVMPVGKLKKLPFQREISTSFYNVSPPMYPIIWSSILYITSSKVGKYTSANALLS